MQPRDSGRRKPLDRPRIQGQPLEILQRASLRGRGAATNPSNRFDRLVVEEDPSHLYAAPDEFDESSKLSTVFLPDSSRTILARNDSPDVPFSRSINPYRGCEHGCAYCYARPTHEYLGLSAGLDFESKILVKENAPELLRRELMAPSWKPQIVGLSGVTDPYQPIERKLELTRRCLLVLADFSNPVQIVTKNSLITRDLDVLSRLAKERAAAVMISITTLHGGLVAKLEPRTSHPERRLAAIRQLKEAGVPVGVLIAPVIPAINDHEIPRILEAARDAGAAFAGCIVLRLPGAVADLFGDWLDRHFPERREKVLARLREMRGGRINDPRFGTRMRGEGLFADQIRALFEVSRRRAGFPRQGPELSVTSFRRPAQQLSLPAPE